MLSVYVCISVWYRVQEHSTLSRSSPLEPVLIPNNAMILSSGCTLLLAVRLQQSVFSRVYVSSPPYPSWRRSVSPSYFLSWCIILKTVLCNLSVWLWWKHRVAPHPPALALSYRWWDNFQAGVILHPVINRRFRTCSHMSVRARSPGCPQSLVNGLLFDLFSGGWLLSIYWRSLDRVNILNITNSDSVTRCCIQADFM